MTRLREAHAGAIGAIRTIHFRVTYEHDQLGVSEGEYWRSGDLIRLHWTERGSANKAIVRDGIARYLTRQDVGADEAMKRTPEVQQNLEAGRYYWHGGVEPVKAAGNFSFNPWAKALCAINDDAKSGVSFEEFARNHEKDLLGIRRATEGSVTTIAIEFKYKQFVTEFHLDPAVNYMIRKIVSRSKADDSFLSSAEVVQYAEVSPSVYFPTKVVSKRFQQGKHSPESSVTFSEVEVNRPLSQSAQTWKYRHGVYLTDRVEGKKYRVNEDGAPLGPKGPIPVAIAPPATSRQEPGAVTSNEPRRWGWWIMPASLGLFVVAGGVWLARRRRATTE